MTLGHKLLRHILHNPFDKATHLEDDKFEEGSRVQLLVRIGSLQLKCLRKKRDAGSSRMISQRWNLDWWKLIGFKRVQTVSIQYQARQHQQKNTENLKKLHGT